jgi:hypothetical protein
MSVRLPLRIRIAKKLRKLELKLRGEVEIRHYLEWYDSHGHHVIGEWEAIPKEALRSVDSKNILNNYHEPWFQQQLRERNLNESTTRGIYSWWEMSKDE